MLFRILFFLISVFLYASPTIAQTLEELEEKANKFLHQDIDSSVFYFHKLEALALLKADTLKLKSAYLTLGGLYDQLEKHELAIEYLSKSDPLVSEPLEKGELLVSLAKNIGIIDLEKSDSIFREAELMAETLQDTNLFAQVYGNFANIKHTSGDISGSLNYYFKALDYTTHDLPRSIIYSNLANNFLLLKNMDRAEEYLLKTIYLCEKNNYKSRNSIPAVIYARILMSQGAYELAEIEIKNAIAYFQKHNIEHYLIQCYNLYTALAIQLNEWEKASYYNEKSIANFSSTGANFQCQTLSNTCRILQHKGQYTKAMEVADRMLAIASRSNIPLQKQEAYFFKSKIYEQLNRRDLAYDDIKNYNRLRDSLFRSDQVMLINYLETQYHRKEQESAIALLDSQNNLQQAKLTLQQKIIGIGGISFFIILVLLAFLLFLIKKIKSKNGIISKALGEKDILLREIHHRVKNNLQLVSSLLSLQSRHVEDPGTLEVLNSGKSRIRSMALIHQDLYDRENLTGVRVKDYLEKLSGELLESYHIDSNKIEIQTDIEDIELDIDTLIPLGLIINELITNAFKYAFPNNKPGIINIKLSEYNNQLLLEVQDNGIGFDHSNVRSKSFGYKLIKALLYQLQGELRQEVNNGTHLFLSFNHYKTAA